MKILVIDDFAGNIASAKTTLTGHKVTTADSIEQAFKTLESDEHFDVVLTDLFMPVDDFVGAMNTRRYANPQGDLPAGLVFAIKAANKGIPAVLFTDADHHSDWICTLLDLIGHVSVRYGKGDKQQRVSYVEARTACLKAYWDEASSSLVACDHYPEGKQTIKDWAGAMNRSGLFEETFGQI